MNRSFLFLLLAVVLVACEKPTDPDAPGGADPSTVKMTHLTDLPMTGGDVASVAITPDNRILAVIDGKLQSVTTSGAMTLINGEAQHWALALAPSGEIYTVTATDFRTYDAANGTYRDVPIDPAGPFAIGRRIEDVEIIISPSGVPYVKIINNTPQTYVYYSEDKGTSWKELKLPNGFQYNGGLAFAPNGDMYMSSTYGVYRSTDRGATWTTYPTARAGYGGRLFTTPNGYLYHYPPKGGGLKVSKDGGASFTELTPFNADPFFSTIQPAPDGSLYGLAGSQLLHSTDGGAHWTPVLLASGPTIATRGSMIVVGMTSAQFSGGRYGGLALSQDNGATWTPIGSRPVEGLSDMAIDRNGSLLMVAEDGLYRKLSSGWQTLGTRQGGLGRVAVDGGGRILIATITDVSLSTDNGVTWTRKLLADHVPGLDPEGVTGIVGRPGGGFVVAIAGYSDSRGYSNGHLYTIAADGTPTLVTGLGITFSSLAQDRNGVLYGGSQFLDPISYTFRGRSYSSHTGGISWDEETKGSGPAFNSQNMYFSTSGSNGDFALKTVGSDQSKALTLEGFTSRGNYIKRVMFDSSDRLYLITLDEGMFISTGAVR